MSISKIYTIIYIDCEQPTEDQISFYSDICKNNIQNILGVDKSICEVNYAEDEYESVLTILIGIDSERTLIEADLDFLNASEHFISDLTEDEDEELRVRISANDLTNLVCQTYECGEYDTGSISTTNENYDEILNKLIDEIKSRRKSTISKWLRS